jgi:hypothetical protein
MEISKKGYSFFIEEDFKNYNQLNAINRSWFFANNIGTQITEENNKITEEQIDKEERDSRLYANIRYLKCKYNNKITTKINEKSSNFFC